METEGQFPSIRDVRSLYVRTLYTGEKSLVNLLMRTNRVLYNGRQSVVLCVDRLFVFHEARPFKTMQSALASPVNLTLVSTA